MQKIQIIILLTLIVFGIYCKNNNSEQSKDYSGSSDPNTSVVTPVSEKASSNKMLLYAWVDKLRLRKAPDTNSEIVKELSEGEPLNFLGDKTDFTEKINLRGTLFDEPWLKVETKSGEVGWVFGGGVKPYKNTVDAAPSPYDACYKMQKEGQTDDFQACIGRIKEKQLKKDGRYVQATQDGYEFRLLGGNHIEIGREPGGAETYDYRYYIPQMGYFIVEATREEGGDFLLINDKSGKQTRIWGYPKPASDYKHLVALGTSLNGDNAKNGIQILGFTQNGLQVVWEKELAGYMPVLALWVDDRTIEISMMPAANDGGKREKVAQLSQNELGEWVLSD